MNNLIQQLKDNEKPFGLMSEKMQEALIKCTAINGPQVAQRFIEDDEWIDCKDNDFSPWYTYRLRLGYEDEPEIIERKITIGGCSAWLDKLVYTDEKVLEQGICEANVDPDFIGFKLEDGFWHDQPIKPVNAAGEVVFGPIKVSDIISGAVRILHATHVLVRRNKKE